MSIRPQWCQRLGDHRGDRGLVGDRERHCQCFAAGRAISADDGVRCGLGQVVDDDFGAVARQIERMAAPQASARTGDDGCSTRQRQRHGALRFDFDGAMTSRVLIH
jgi:hypothetical protein